MPWREADPTRDTSSELREPIPTAPSKAEAAREADSRWLARMSREMRIPATAILDCADRLSDENLLDAERAEAVDRLRSHARHLLWMLDDISDLSHAETASRPESILDREQPAADSLADLRPLAVPESPGLIPQIPSMLISPGSLSKEGDSLLRPPRILVAEDYADNRCLIVHLLKKSGAQVEEAVNGRTAVEKALAADRTDEPFDLILMDMQMPEMDGYAATRSLRAQGYAGPIVALTAYSMKGDRENCLAAGCDDYLSKPLSPTEFWPVIARQLISAPDRPVEL